MKTHPKHKTDWVLYYDGECGLCVRVKNSLARMDFFGRVAWVPSQRLDTPPEGLSWADLRRDAYLKTAQGRLYDGFYAFRMLTLRLPPLMPLAPVLWLPGVAIAGRALYRWVADNRYRFSSRCAVPSDSAH